MVYDMGNLITSTLFAIWCDLYNLKVVRKYAWRSVIFSKVVLFKVLLLLTLTLLQGYFSRFLNCANDTKRRKASHLINKNKIKVANAFSKKVF